MLECVTGGDWEMDTRLILKHFCCQYLESEPHVGAEVFSSFFCLFRAVPATCVEFPRLGVESEL